MWTATMALNNITGAGKTADWSVHFIEHAVSAFYDITHAVGLAVLTPYWMEYVVKDAASLSKFVALADVFEINKNGLSDLDITKQVIMKVREFFNSLAMPDNLQKVGAKIEDIDGMVVSSLRGADKIGNFKHLYAKDVKNILINSFGK
jgi:alcohol dehydrogenase YqhD (iron-dependent ADH family)